MLTAISRYLHLLIVLGPLSTGSKALNAEAGTAARSAG
jgi:hypothetical protein